MEDQLKKALHRFRVPELRNNIVLENKEFIRGYYSLLTNKFHFCYDNNQKNYPFLSHHVAAMIKKHPDTDSIVRSEHTLINASVLTTSIALFSASRFRRTSIAVGMTSLGFNLLSRPVVTIFHQFSGMVSAMDKLIASKDFEDVAYGSIFTKDLVFRGAILFSGNRMKREYREDGIHFTFSPIFHPSQKTQVRIDYPDEMNSEF